MDILWAKYYASGDPAIVKKLITECYGLVRKVNAAQMTQQMPQAMEFMHAYEYTVVTLINEGMICPYLSRRILLLGC